MVAEIAGDPFCLAEIAGAVGTGINFDQPDDIGIDGTYKGDDPLQVCSCFLEKSGIGHGQMETLFVAGTVTDIVK